MHSNRIKQQTKLIGLSVFATKGMFATFPPMNLGGFYGSLRIKTSKNPWLVEIVQRTK